MEGVITRRGRASDLDEVLRLWRQMVEFHADLDERLAMRTDAEALESVRTYFEACLDSPDSRLLVAEGAEQEGLLGFLLAHIRTAAPVALPSTYGFVSDIAVDEGLRRRGVGQVLFLAARAWFQERGLSLIRANVAAANPTAQAFWRQMGGEDEMVLMRIAL